MHRLEQRMKTLHLEQTSSNQQREKDKEREREKEIGSATDDEVFDSDLILGKLFFSSKLSALSPGIQFDSSIRYLDLSSPEQLKHLYSAPHLRTLTLLLLCYISV